MVGGGEGAYIGNIHRMSARLDGAFQLVAGAFDIDAGRGRSFAATQGIEPARAHDDFQAMIAGELAREDRIDTVAICTPNHTHFPIAKAFLEAGFDVICEKPLTTTLDDAKALERVVRETGRFMGVTYTYSGYPMVHEARAMRRSATRTASAFESTARRGAGVVSGAAQRAHLFAAIRPHTNDQARRGRSERGREGAHPHPGGPS
jgi:predicted dehydrogenase